MVGIAALFVDAPMPDSIDSTVVIDSLLSFDFEMLAISLRLSSFANVTEAHKFVGPPNVVQLAVDAMLHVVSVIVHLVAAKLYSDTVEKKKEEQKMGRINKPCIVFIENSHRENFSLGMYAVIRFNVIVCMHACSLMINCNFALNDTQLLHLDGFSAVPAGPTFYPTSA